MGERTSAGGFIAPLSPPASVASQPTRTLPEPRRSMLKHGGNKEAQLFSYLDTTMDKIDGKVERRYEVLDAKPANPDVGYSRLDQVVKDLDETVNVVWVSSTPSLQIPFLLTIAGRLIDYLGRFEFTPREAFRLLTKLDLVFSSLLTGVDFESKVPLPNVNSLTMNVTEKVRLRSIVESTRVAVVNAYGKASGAGVHGDAGATDDEGTVSETGTATETETETGTEGTIRRFFDEGEDEDEDDWDMALARVYEHTIELLGSLDTDPIGSYSDYGTRPFAY